MAISGVSQILTISNDEDLTKLCERADAIDTTHENIEMRSIIKELKRTVRKNNLLSLSAPAIGYNKRIFCIAFDGDVKTFINPIITHVDGLTISKETCTSIPDKVYIRPRNTTVDAMYMTPTGKIESRQFLGVAAYIFQHEMDHLDGLLLCDIGAELPEDYDKLSEDDRSEFIKEYLDELDLLKSELNAEIESTPELKELSDGIKYMTSVAKGETQVERGAINNEDTTVENTKTAV